MNPCNTSDARRRRDRSTGCGVEIILPMKRRQHAHRDRAAGGQCPVVRKHFIADGRAIAVRAEHDQIAFVGLTRIGDDGLVAKDRVDDRGKRRLVVKVRRVGRRLLGISLPQPFETTTSLVPPTVIFRLLWKTLRMLEPVPAPTNCIVTAARFASASVMLLRRRW